MPHDYVGVPDPRPVRDRYLTLRLDSIRKRCPKYGNSGWFQVFALSDLADATGLNAPLHDRGDRLD